MKYINLNLILLVITILFFSFKVNSQNTQSGGNIVGNINTSGNNISGSTGTVSYSIGQVFYTYIEKSDYIVAQGIQQEEKNAILSSPEKTAEPAMGIIVFPNPTTDFVTISMTGTEYENGQRFYRLYDFQGRVLRENTIKEAQTQIELEDFRTSIYLLTVYFNSEILKTFKIIKK